ncbi:hypothetical protein L873DRAFT_1789961 [Choiromyces venosus 120613-1]|uniref:Uncharacterized protein n=1 Tax=Choiromyces venosus 120613-1 TaxID=1336337 RepID=A0A3N4JKP8_9PEZI|nr:hypothetical protein L873DRAFT_1789961 [Choiromyces venosus 120613-1]
MTPEDHTERPLFLIVYQKQLRLKHAITGDRESIERAAELSGQALVIRMSSDHPSRAELLHDHGHDLLYYFGEVVPLEARDLIIKVDLEAWSLLKASFRTRIMAARRIGLMSHLQRKYDFGAFILEQAWVDQKDQQHNLSNLDDIATAAVALVLNAGKSAYHALKLLELGRGVTIDFTIDRRSDLSALRSTSPELYDAFNSLRIQIDAPVGASAGIVDTGKVP